MCAHLGEEGHVVLVVAALGVLVVFKALVVRVDRRHAVGVAVVVVVVVAAAAVIVVLAVLLGLLGGGERLLLLLLADGDLDPHELLHDLRARVAASSVSHTARGARRPAARAHLRQPLPDARGHRAERRAQQRQQAEDGHPLRAEAPAEKGGG